MSELNIDHQNLLDAFDNGILLLDLDENITFVNEKLLEITGYLKGDIIGKNSGFLFKKEKTMLRTNYRKDIDVETGINQLLDKNNNIIGKVVIIQNLIELKEKINQNKHETLTDLNKFMVEQSEINEYDQLTSLVAEQLTKFLNAAVTIYNEYDENNKQLVSKEVKGNTNIIKIAQKIMGKRIVDIKTPVTDKIYQEILDNKIKLAKSVHEASMGSVSKTISNFIERYLKLKSLIILAYTDDEKLFATTTIALKEDIEGYMIELLRTYVYFTGVSLKRIKMANELKESELNFRRFFENMIEGSAIHEMIFDDHNQPTDYRFLDVNEKFEQLMGLKKEMVVGKTIKEVSSDYDNYLIETYGKRVINGESVNFEYYSKLANKTFDISAFNLKQNYFASTFNDITETKKTKQRIEYLSFHDTLTGLKNRNYMSEMETQIDKEENYPLSVIIMDLNGLKLLNDTYGHQAGDRTLKCAAEVLKSACREKDILIRYGGDEFIVLLPNTDKNEVHMVCNMIKNESKKKCFNCSKQIQNFALSLALGSATRENSKIELSTIIVEAENQMYREKLTESRSARNAIISAFLETLKAKNFEESHITRMLTKSEQFGKAVGLNREEINTLDLLINLHDIGKINISENIISKQEPLTREEWLEVKQHPEIGYRIAKATEDFSHVAQYILCHHENWNGTGYPQGLKGHEIPMISRILSILDAWEVMSGGRPYKAKMSQKAIIEEFEKCRGTQFDPALTEAFIEILQKPKVLIK